MRRESEPIYGSASATTNYNNLLHHHGQHHNGHHQQAVQSPSVQSGHLTNGTAAEPSVRAHPAENGTLGETDPGGLGAFQGHHQQQHQQHQQQQLLQQQQQLADHQQTLSHQHHHHSHRSALSPATTASFGGLPGLCNGSSSYAGYTSFGLNCTFPNAKRYLPTAQTPVLTFFILP